MTIQEVPAVRWRGPGRRPRFYEEDVIREALDIGLGSFTYSGLAQRLGVATSALYRLFPNRDMVVRACLERLIGACRTPDPGMAWQSVLRLWSAEIWRLMGDCDGLATVIMGYDNSGEVLAPVWQAYTDALLAQGKTRRQTVFALCMLADIAIGAGQRSSGVPDSSGAAVVEELWGGSPDLRARTDVVIEVLERHWPDAPLPDPDGSVGELLTGNSDSDHGNGQTPLRRSPGASV